jgi:anti-sigma regulatory factor (Ser/Thr protein kinase)
MTTMTQATIMTTLVQTVLQPTPRCVASARDAVHEALERIGLERMADDASLLTSELVTNGVRHAGTTLSLRAEFDGRRVRVELEDRELRPPQQRAREQHEPGGLGLTIIDVIASRWGYESVDDRGKVVWFELDAHRGKLPHGDPGSN